MREVPRDCFPLPPNILDLCKRSAARPRPGTTQELLSFTVCVMKSLAFPFLLRHSPFLPRWEQNVGIRYQRLFVSLPFILLERQHLGKRSHVPKRQSSREEHDRRWPLRAVILSDVSRESVYVIHQQNSVLHAKTQRPGCRHATDVVYSHGRGQYCLQRARASDSREGCQVEQLDSRMCRYKATSRPAR